MLSKTYARLFVLAAAALWGTLSIFVRTLSKAGLGAMEVVQLRFSMGLLLLGLYLLLFRRGSFRVKWKDLWCFVGAGACSLLLFTYCQFTGMEITSVSVMTVLLYTAPIFVMLMSVLLFCEKLSWQKIVALLAGVWGCTLVAGLGGEMQIAPKGLVLGLLSGFFYALYSIFGRYSLQKEYDSWTITFYSFLFCVIGGMFICDWSQIYQVMATQPSMWYVLLAMGIVTAFLPYVLYTMGLSGMESSQASILASLEPIVATIVSIVLFHEPLYPIQALGIAFVIVAVCILSLNLKHTKNTERISL